MFFLFCSFKGGKGAGAKIKRLFEIVKALLQIKINCTKYVLKCHIYIKQL